MKFTSFTYWLNENEKNLQSVTILYPGSFKPLHFGHISLIKRYIKHPSVKEVKVLIGPGIRNGITQNEAFQIANLLLSKYSNVSIEAVRYPSPILTAYKYMETAQPGIYAMAGVKKGNDYERVLKFVKDFAIRGKYEYTLPKGVNVVELGVNTEPILYKGRTDEYDEQPISASILRRDIINDDFNNFLTNYPWYDIDIIKKIYDMTQMIITEINEPKYEEELND